jgi:hypothetical protein
MNNLGAVHNGLDFYCVDFCSGGMAVSGMLGGIK